MLIVTAMQQKLNTYKVMRASENQVTPGRCVRRFLAHVPEALPLASACTMHVHPGILHLLVPYASWSQVGVGLWSNSSVLMYWPRISSGASLDAKDIYTDFQCRSRDIQTDHGKSIHSITPLTGKHHQAPFGGPVRQS